MRIVAFAALLILSTLVPWLWLLLGALVYAIFWSGYELLAIGFLIDSFFGSHTLWPQYTVTIAILLLLTEWLKPKLLVYNK